MNTQNLLKGNSPVHGTKAENYADGNEDPNTVFN